MSRSGSLGVGMSIQIVPHDKKFEPAVEACSQRMEKGGSKWGFYPSPIPDWTPFQEGAKSCREYHLALEDDEIVRDAYGLKPQHWLINGKMELVTDWQGPFTEVVSEFGPWADDLWEKNKDTYSCLAVRDRAMMNTLMPQQGWPGGTRLKFANSEGVVLGWSIVHHKQLTDDARFGSMHVGLITDFFASPEDAASVVSATHAYLVSQKVDMIFANILSSVD